jgi:hypothetical protein
VVGVVESEPVLNYIKDTKNNHTGILTCDHQHVWQLSVALSH